MVSAVRQQIIGGGGAPINKSRRRRPQIVGGGGAARPAYGSNSQAANRNKLISSGRDPGSVASTVTSLFGYRAFAALGGG